MLLSSDFNKESALMLKAVTLPGINHNLNTSRSNYPNICTTHTYEQRNKQHSYVTDLGLKSAAVVSLVWVEVKMLLICYWI